MAGRRPGFASADMLIFSSVVDALIVVETAIQKGATSKESKLRADDKQTNGEVGGWPLTEVKK